MSTRSTVLTLVALLAGAGVAAAAPAAPRPAAAGVLDLVPEDADCALVVRNLAELKKKGDKLVADTKIQIGIRPSDAMAFVYQLLGLNAGVDENAAAAIVLASPKSVGAKNFNDRIEDRLVAVVPFTDRGKLAGNYNLKAADLKPDKVVEVKNGNQGLLFGKSNKLFVPPGKYAYYGFNEGAVRSVASGKRLAAVVDAAQRRAAADADLLLHLGVGVWGKEWKEEVKRLGDRLGEKDETARQFLDTLGSLRHGMLAVRVGDGLGFSLLAVFDKDNATARQFLATLRGGGEAAGLTGLPEGRVIAAEATRGHGGRTAHVARLFARVFLQEFIPSRWLVSPAEQPNFVAVFTEVWKRLRGTRAAVYRNADEHRHGLFSAVAILDTEDPAKFLAELRQLAHFAGDIDLSDKADKEDVAAIGKLIRDLGDDAFAVRESASAKLGLIGEPALPYLEKALASDDAEVRRRAKNLKARIVDLAARRRKELLSRDLPRHIKPTFAFVRTPEKLAGHRVDVVKVKLSDKDSAFVPQLRQLFGPDWDKVRLAVHGKQVVVLMGSDEKLLLAALGNLKEDRPGLAASKSLAAFRRQGNPAHKAEFHLSVGTVLGLMAAEDLRKPGARPDDALSSLALTVGADRLQVDLWVPVAEIKAVVKQKSW